MAKMMKVPESVSGMLRDRVQACGLTQTELCRRADVDHGVLSRFMLGKRSITVDTADKIWAALLAAAEEENVAKGK